MKKKVNQHLFLFPFDRLQQPNRRPPWGIWQRGGWGMNGMLGKSSTSCMGTTIHGQRRVRIRANPRRQPGHRGNRHLSGRGMSPAERRGAAFDRYASSARIMDADDAVSVWCLCERRRPENTRWTRWQMRDEILRSDLVDTSTRQLSYAAAFPRISSCSSLFLVTILFKDLPSLTANIPFGIVFAGLSPC
jgi:hypothetical protein